jgi:hypothetical protein
MSGYYDLRSFVLALEQWGFTSVLLPFLLIFTIVFAIFQKVKILGEKKSYNVVIALVVSLTTVIPHVTGSYHMNYDPVVIINRFLPQVSLLIIAIVMLLLLVGIWGAESDWAAGNIVTSWIVILSVVAIVWTFGAAANWWQGWYWLENIFGTDTIAILIMILVFGLIIWFVTSDENESKGNGFMKGLGGLFSKSK